MRLLMLCALTVTCLLQPISAVQESPENALIKRVAARLRQVQSSWQFVGGICTCPPLMEEQEGIAVGGWYHGTRGHLKEIAHVTVYRISSAEAASRWLDGFIHGGAAEGWMVEAYNLADEACLSTYGDSARYTITFRKGLFLVTVSGASRRNVELVARHVLVEVAAEQQHAPEPTQPSSSGLVGGLAPAR